MRKSNVKGNPISVAMISLGCAKNLVDSEEMLARLGLAGCVVGAPMEEADAIVVNTCAFVAPARAEARKTIRIAASLRREGPCRRLVVAGCLPQRDGDKLRKEFPEIDALVGTGDFPGIADIVVGGAGDALGPPDHLSDHAAPRLLTTGPWTANLKIAEGCSNRCAYCVIPQLRGPHRSRTISDVAAEARNLVSAGAKEIILISQDTTAFGADRHGGETLAKLLKHLDSIGGLRWIRVMYAHPARVTDELIETIAASRRVLHYLDIPLQHAHPDVLRRMGRPGDAEMYLNLIERLRRAMPDVCLRTTFITGFPGETERNFDALCRFVKAARFDRVGVFAYSRESGTRAASLDGQVAPAEKKQRRVRLMEFQKSISATKNKSLVHSEMDALVESSGGGLCVGRTYRDAPEVDGSIKIRRCFAEPGQFVRVRIAAATAFDLTGETISIQL